MTDHIAIPRLAAYYTAGRVVGWSNEKVAEWERGLKRKRPRVSPRPLEG